MIPGTFSPLCSRFILDHPLSRTMITSDSDELPDPTEPNNLGGGW